MTEMTQGQFVQTTACRKHGHPEITLGLEAPPLVPGLERMLLSYFESGVARGVRFAPGQTVTFGWAHLRLTQRPDGTVGVQAYDLREKSQWSDWVDTALMTTWQQQQVAASLGVQDLSKCPYQSQTAIVCRRLRADLPELQLKRFEPSANNKNDSGWFVGCFDEDHDHDSRENLALASLESIASILPVTPQFFVLPWECAVLLDYNGRTRVRATVLIDGEERAPWPGSYLERLSSTVGM